MGVAREVWVHLSVWRAEVAALLGLQRSVTWSQPAPTFCRWLCDRTRSLLPVAGGPVVGTLGFRECLLFSPLNVLSYSVRWFLPRTLACITRARAYFLRVLGLILRRAVGLSVLAGLPRLWWAGGIFGTVQGDRNRVRLSFS